MRIPSLSSAPTGSTSTAWMASRSGRRDPAACGTAACRRRHAGLKAALRQPSSIPTRSFRHARESTPRRRRSFSASLGSAFAASGRHTLRVPTSTRMCGGVDSASSHRQSSRALMSGATAASKFQLGVRCRSMRVLFHALPFQHPSASLPHQRTVSARPSHISKVEALQTSHLTHTSEHQV